MQNPTATKIINGQRYPYIMLRYEREVVDEFWRLWWENRDVNSLTRPYTIVDSDPLLIPTDRKPTVDTIYDDIFFNNPLRNAISRGQLCRHRRVDREQFREELVSLLAARCANAEGRPEVIFTGGGYGSGKTASIQYLLKVGALPNLADFRSLQGVDYCKQLIPEFNLLKAVSDGRASETCQNESRLISSQLFRTLVEQGKSFAWDSSMSSQSESLERIEMCKSAGYTVRLVAVLTDLEVAVRRAMGRAHITKRFAHPDFLSGSHAHFRASLETYLETVDSALVLENTAEWVEGGGPQVVTVKNWELKNP